jgi:hypothetical protein
MLSFRMLLVAVLPLLVAHTTLAEDNSGDKVAVGTCKPKLTSFATIQAAVNKVSPGTTVLVCPGTYPEQVTISQPLTLQGIADSNLDQITITIPTGGLPQSVPSMFGQSVAAQVLVQNAGPVNISNIAVDGTGGDQGCAAWLAGIFYGSGSSGSVSWVKAGGQIDAGCGVGIWAENAGDSNKYVSIQASSVHDIDAAGFFAGSGVTPTLTVQLKDNFVSTSGAVGVVLNNVNGQITDNNLSNALAGIFDLAPATRISSNNVISTAIGVLLLSGGTVESNDLINSGIGVFLGAGGASVRSNRITLAATAGIEFGCNAGTVANNTINDAPIGLDQVPSTFNGTNRFANTATIRTNGCVAAAATNSMQAVFQRLTRSGLPPSKWRTPANPLGLRPW